MQSYSCFCCLACNGVEEVQATRRTAAMLTAQQLQLAAGGSGTHSYRLRGGQLPCWAPNSGS